MSDCTHIMLYGIRSFLESSKVLDPHSSMSALPPVTEILCTLYLNIFREEPAISKFDWPFTLISNHPRLLLQTSVRSSKRHYAFFNLFKIRSLSFGSNEPNIMPLSTCFCSASTSLLTHTCFI